MKIKNIYVVGSIIGAAGFIFVYDSANLGSSIKYLEKYFNLSTSLISLTVSISLLGNLLGSFLGGLFCDRIGRKNTILYGSTIGLLGLIVTMLSWNISTFWIGRVILGFSIGIVFVAAPMYATEISPASKRGKVGTIRQILLACGLIAGYTVNYFFKKFFSLEWCQSVGWRYLIGIEAFLLLLIVLTFNLLYETPRWLMIKNRDDEAKEVLKTFTNSSKQVDLAYSQMVSERDKDSKIKNIKIKGGLIYPIIICIIFPIFRQLSGVNAVTYYAQKIFNDISKDSSSLAYFQSIFIGFSELFGAIVVVLLADKMGRKFFLSIGALGMFVSEGIIAYFLYKNEMSLNISYFIYIYNFFYIISAGAMLTVYLSEVTPTIVRSKGIALTGMLNWISDAFVIYSFPLVEADVYLNKFFHNSLPFMIFSGSMLIFFIVILFLPETKGKTLEEISDYWREKGEW